VTRGPWIQTYSGRKLYLADPRPEDFCLEDIAHATARINRFTGHGGCYSVAQHMVLAAEMAERHYARSGDHLMGRMLLHDAVEAYYGDVSSPLKALLPGYRELELRAERMIESAFGVAFLEDPRVKEIDLRMLLTERPIVFRHVLPWDEQWCCVPDGLNLHPFPLSEDWEVDWRPWGPEMAEDEYLRAARKWL
jgi:hypothetical protein